MKIRIKSRIIAWFKNHPKIGKLLIQASLGFIITFLGILAVFTINNAMLQVVKGLSFMIWFTWASVGWITGLGASWLLQNRDDKKNMIFVKKEVKMGAKLMEAALDEEMDHIKKQFHEEVSNNVEYIVNNIGKDLGFQVKREDVEKSVEFYRNNFDIKQAPKDFRQN